MHILQKTPVSHMGFDPDMIRKYDQSGPRYTSYPTANLFSGEFRPVTYARHARASNEHLVPKSLSLYFHIPFCDTLCFYCACNKIVTKNRSHADAYLEHLYREIRMQSELFDRDREVVQLHLGGGTPTFLSGAQIRGLLEETGRRFRLSTDDTREFSIEIDPRGIDAGHLAELHDIGFNRISLGVQDFNPEVQKAVHRVQSPEDTLDLIVRAREMGFRSTNVDLIYGLPLQTEQTFRATLQRLLEVRPERLSIFNYAHLPSLFYPQQRIREADLPPADEKLRILETTIDMLDEAGYRYIGMDHFAVPEDGLARAQEDGTLYRNFQGYSTFSNCDLIGLGVSSISQVDLCYSQNHKTLEEYYDAIDAGALPVARGLEMNRDDLIRRHVIEKLICYYGVELDGVCDSAGLSFDEYFGSEWSALDDMRKDGLVELDARQHAVRITETGRFMLRNICMTFDQYLRGRESTATFSKVI